MALNRIQIANMACGEVPCSRIADFEEDSVEAGHIRTHYRPSLEMLLETHDWDFAIKRVTLAEIANDRPNEFAHAYQLPPGVGSTRRLIPVNEGASSGTVVAGLQTVAYPSHFYSNVLDEHANLHPFEIANGKIYANLAPAVLEFITTELSESAFTALFARALALELASRIVVPIKQDTKRQDYLTGKAEVARERAIADNMNRQPRNQYGFISEDAQVRSWGP